MEPEEIEATFGDAARAALEQFPVEAAALSPVNLSENATFRVDSGDGRRWVLRLHRPGYHSLDELNSERDWTHALNEAGVRTQAGLRTRGGEHFCRIEVESRSEERFAGLTEWVEGELLDDRLEDDPDEATLVATYRQVGALAGAIHNQSASWQPPAGFVRHRLDGDGLLGEAPFWGRFWEHPDLEAADRDVLLGARATAAALLAEYGESPDRFGLIHADLHANNVLVGEGGVTIIDFDDAGFGWHAYELAVALYNEQSNVHFGAMRDALVEGYRGVRDFTDRDVAMVDVFLVVRGMAIIGWLADRPEVAQRIDFAGYKSGVVESCRRFLAG